MHGTELRNRANDIVHVAYVIQSRGLDTYTSFTGNLRLLNEDECS